MARTIMRISSKRAFARDDVVNGDKLGRMEWAYARRDALELRKIYSLNVFLRLRKAGKGAREAYEEAAKLVTKANGNHMNWQTVRRWLGAFVEDNGRLRFDQRGRKPSTHSFLRDADIKESALAYVRAQLQLTRAKNSSVPPLTIDKFHRWCNDVLLKPLLEQDPRLRKIAKSTAHGWLLHLGFEFKSHTKSIYYDGHEREDVVRDRAEKLVMLAVLEEVTVTFSGKNSETVVWPLLHPGEPPVVWVSQDECAFHSNDDQPSEWAEHGKGLQIKQKSRGALLMVSAFISELHGHLRCTLAQRDAFVAAHPQSIMAARLAAEPSWSGSSMLILEPGAAGSGKDKYFDAAQLMEQTKLAMEVFEATHVAPGRWAYHPSRHGPVTATTYPISVEAVWLPPTPCKALFFYDHSSGHGAMAKESLSASNGNKGPDWKGAVHPMRDAWFVNAQGNKQTQVLQFEEGDRLTCNIVCPPGVDPDDAAGPAQPAAQPAAQPEAPVAATAVEAEAAFKLFFSGCHQTLKKHHPNRTAAELKDMGREKWGTLSVERQLVYVCRLRAKESAGAPQAAASRIIKEGSLVPRALWGRNKGLEIILSERGLYPAAGLKGACPNAKSHTPANDCCCVRLLATQPDFAAECSALQHLVEGQVAIPGTTMTTARHHCFFLPKFHCELNWIERMWGASKQYTRTHCLYTLPGLRETVPISLSQNIDDVPMHLRGSDNLPVAPVLLQRRWARISRQYMLEYRKGLNACDAIKAVKCMRSKRHRDVSDARSRPMEAAMAAMSNNM
jgi:hypothetical protein